MPITECISKRMRCTSHQQRLVWQSHRPCAAVGMSQELGRTQPGQHRHLLPRSCSPARQLTHSPTGRLN